MTPYEQGQLSTLTSLGLVKHAASPVDPAMLKKIIPWQRRWGGGIRRAVIGQPTRFWEEMKGGPRTLFGKGSLIREGFSAPGMVGKAFMYGVPTYQAINAVTDKDPNNAKQIGQLVGSTALGFAMFSPVGLLGSMAGYSAGDTIGEGVSRLFSKSNQ